MHNPNIASLAASAADGLFSGRESSRAAFLERTGWTGAQSLPVGEDCAFRRYFRLTKAGKRAILMEALPDDHPQATPGHRMGDFVRIAAWLRAAGLNAPEIYDADHETGYVLLEDFGDTSFKAALQGGRDAASLYGLATETLSFIRENVPRALELPHYYESHVHKGLVRVIDWYVPALRQGRNPAGLAADYLAVWRSIEDTLPPCPQGFLHIDFHFENLMWLPERDGLARCGILDFQGAMTGPQPYDLANLLEDARVTVSPDLRRAMLDRYCRDMSAEDRTLFASWYRILATQFHCRVIGQFIRLAVRDGKDRYLPHLPRLAGYLREGLSDPVLEPLRLWFMEQGIDFETIPVIDPAAVQGWISEEAF